MQQAQYPEGGTCSDWGSCNRGGTQEAARNIGHLAARSQRRSALVLSLPPPAPSPVAEPRSPGTACKGIL